MFDAGLIFPLALTSLSKIMIKVFLEGFLSGISIALGGTGFLLCESRVVGALLFSVGLFSVCVFGWLMMLLLQSYFFMVLG